MAFLTALAIGVAAAGVGVGVAGMVQQRAGQKQQAEYQQQAISLQQQQDAQRRQQMELDATRRKREMIRQSIIARSQALAATTAGGANTSSALPGAYGGVSGRTNVNELGVNQNEQIGENMFSIQGGITAANAGYARAGASAAAGAGMVSLGNMFIQNSSTISKIGGSVGGWFQSENTNPFLSSGARNNTAYPL